MADQNATTAKYWSEYELDAGGFFSLSLLLVHSKHEPLRHSRLQNSVLLMV